MPEAWPSNCLPHCRRPLAFLAGFLCCTSSFPSVAAVQRIDERWPDMNSIRRRRETWIAQSPEEYEDYSSTTTSPGSAASPGSDEYGNRTGHGNGWWLPDIDGPAWKRIHLGPVDFRLPWWKRTKYKGMHNGTHVGGMNNTQYLSPAAQAAYQTAVTAAQNSQVLDEVVTAALGAVAVTEEIPPEVAAAAQATAEEGHVPPSEAKILAAVITANTSQVAGDAVERGTAALEGTPGTVATTAAPN